MEVLIGFMLVTANPFVLTYYYMCVKPFNTFQQEYRTLQSVYKMSHLVDGQGSRNRIRIFDTYKT